MRRCILILAVLLLAGCAESTQVASNAADNVADVAAEAVAAAQDKASETQVTTTKITTPVVLAVREAVEAVTPVSVEAPQVPTQRNEPDPAVALITRWEISSEVNYKRNLSAVYCPRSNGPSGPTGGIGYDFGQQTESEIRRVWAFHPDVDVLATASGQVGPGACRAWRSKHRVVITLEDAKRVFETDSLPKYRRMALRANPGLSRQTQGFIAGVSSTGYRRGFSMVGKRNTEKRAIKEVCVPADDKNCAADNTIAMCHVWEGRTDYNGQCNRSKDEARVIRS